MNQKELEIHHQLGVGTNSQIANDRGVNKMKTVADLTDADIGEIYYAYFYATPRLYKLQFTHFDEILPLNYDGFCSGRK